MTFQYSVSVSTVMRGKINIDASSVCGLAHSISNSILCYCGKGATVASAKFPCITGSKPAQYSMLPCTCLRDTLHSPVADLRRHINYACEIRVIDEELDIARSLVCDVIQPRSDFFLDKRQSNSQGRRKAGRFQTLVSLLS